MHHFWKESRTEDFPFHFCVFMVLVRRHGWFDYEVRARMRVVRCTTSYELRDDAYPWEIVQLELLVARDDVENRRVVTIHDGSRRHRPLPRGKFCEKISNGVVFGPSTLVTDVGNHRYASADAQKR